MKKPEPQEQLFSAALRHLIDAEHLADPGPHRSLDQAWHLAGFGPECALKATLASGRYHRIIGHDLDDNEITALVTSLDPLMIGLEPMPTASPPLLKPHWQPDDRYKSTGTFSEAEVSALLDHARQQTLTPLMSLWSMGLLDGDRL